LRTRGQDTQETAPFCPFPLSSDQESFCLYIFLMSPYEAAQSRRVSSLSISPGCEGMGIYRHRTKCVTGYTCMCTRRAIRVSAAILCIPTVLSEAVYMCESVWASRSVCDSAAPVCVGVMSVCVCVCVCVSLECVGGARTHFCKRCYVRRKPSKLTLSQSHHQHDTDHSR